MARTKLFDEALILNKAMNLFWEKGYNATSAQDLVDGLNISRSSLYDTFGDKHSLFVKALKLYREERIDPVLNGLASANDMEQYIRDVFTTVKEDALNDACSKGCFMVNSAVEMAPTDPEIASIVQGIMVDTEKTITQAITLGQERGLFSTRHSAQSLARFVFNALNGLRVTVKFDTDKRMFEDIVDVSLAALKI
ncbi:MULTISPECIES: TetR/AcrR family transcriptional regulator [unclassified Spirosoma]|uniref:TetR/AcrR family transcriptional regulator n=1 Tax=unclassified Spirosoma TaxID=2621999 RepID=UPI00095C97F0|nr:MULTISPECIES: TetR/AcrR family transcriptional regulator [unclassified Spirosoma]MBN8822653.1 TetR/AcrR family transcriptional regulator [Spirosoma sp.]OJW74142.1 MAG: TetR family transcriptional regulator [Spirosoma sp. 48-14]